MNFTAVHESAACGHLATTLGHIVWQGARLIEALLLFHPAVWIISRRMRIERERCCDDAVLVAGTQRMTYVQSLLRVAELRFLEQGKPAGRLVPQVSSLMPLGGCPRNSKNH